MSILALLIYLIIICIVFWAVRMLLAAFGIGDPIKTVVYVIMVVLVLIALLQLLGGGGLPVLRLR